MESEIQRAGFRLHRINAIRGESTACKNWVAKRDSQFKLLGRRLNLKEERKLLTELIQNFPELPDVRYIPDIERDPRRSVIGAAKFATSGLSTTSSAGTKGIASNNDTSAPWRSAGAGAGPLRMWGRASPEF